VDWWADVVNGTNVNLYTGQSIYRYNEKGWNSPAWPDPDELINQQLYNSKFEEVQGSVQFRYNYLKLNYSENLVYAQNTLKNNLFKFKVLTPAVKNIDAIILPAPQNLAIEKLNQVNQLTWNKDVNAKAYYVYRYNENELATLHEIKNVIDIIYPTENDVMTYLDETAEDGTSYRYFVTPFNKTNNEGISAGINTSGVSITTVDKSIIGVMSNIRKTREQVNIFNLLTDYIMNTTSSVFDLTTSLNNIYNDIEDLDEEIIAFDTSELTLKRNNFNDSITELNNLLLSDTTTAEELEVAYSDINTKKAEIETLLNDYQTKFDEFKATRDEINNDIKTFTNTYSINLSNTLEKLDTTQIRTYLDHFITMVAVINEDKENLDSQFQTTIEEINQLNNSVTASETRITKVDRNIQSARLNVDDLIDLADELDEHKAAFGTSFSRFNSTFKAIKIVETKNDLNTQITQLRTSIDEFKANQDKDEDINSETPIIEPVDDPKENKINYPLIIVSFSAVVILSAGIVLIIKNRH
jgi:virulence-associated protein VapD/transcription antitermination factor NusA-like protein